MKPTTIKAELHRGRKDVGLYASCRLLWQSVFTLNTEVLPVHRNRFEFINRIFGANIHDILVDSILC